jgi:hypothetical protein
MAKKKEQALELDTALTLDGCVVTELKNVVIDEIEYISGIIGTYPFLWFPDGKRNTGYECEKDLI